MRASVDELKSPGVVNSEFLQPFRERFVHVRLPCLPVPEVRVLAGASGPASAPLRSPAASPGEAAFSVRDANGSKQKNPVQSAARSGSGEAPTPTRYAIGAGRRYDTFVE